MFLVNVLTCRLKDTRGMSPEVQLRRVMSFMDDFTPAQSEALSLHSVTSSTVFSFPPESNVYCVISAAHFLTGSHVASLRLNCGWLIEQIILLCVFGIKGCFRHSQSFLGSGKLRLQEKVRPKYGSAVNSGANPSRLGLIHRRKPLWANHMLDFFFSSSSPCECNHEKNVDGCGITALSLLRLQTLFQTAGWKCELETDEINNLLS